MARVTLTEVARKAGVNVGTVSRVLNHKTVQGRISDALAERIRKVARQLNYMPNTSAQAVRTGRFNCVAILQSTLPVRSYLPIGVLDGIHDELAQDNMHLTLAKVSDEKLSNPEYMPKILRTFMADGVLINYAFSMPQQLVEAVESGRIPAVWMNAARHTDAVYPDSLAAARQATDYLLSLGHRRIAYLNMGWIMGDEEHYGVRDRREGYSRAMAAAGLQPRELRPPRFPLPPNEEAEFMASWLDAPERPTAVLCYWTNAVWALVRAALSRGMVLPRDLSVTSFAAERYSGVRINAMVEPEYEMGRQAARMLLERIRNSTSGLPSRRLNYTWRDEGSCQSPSPES